MTRIYFFVFLNTLQAMYVIIILMVLSILVASLFLLAYLWSAKTGQFNDPESNAHRILYDNQVKAKPQTSIKNAN